MALILDVDDTHPLIDSTGDASELLEDLIKDWVYDDDYIELKTIKVEKK